VRERERGGVKGREREREGVKGREGEREKERVVFFSTESGALWGPTLWGPTL